VRQSTDIVDLIQSYLPLKRAGTNFRALCPFHNEKTPSFNVHSQKQIFHCFGCGVGGDVFKFVMLRENLNFIEAVRLLARRAGIELQEEPATGEATASASRKDLLYQLHDEVCSVYQKILAADPRGEEARAYLKKRGVSAESVKTFRLGFAPEGWDNVLKWAANKGIAADLLEVSGLVSRNEKGNLYDRFRGRLMFPICDEQGRVIAFSGRVLKPDAKEAKYVNSPETPIFKKGQTFYGLDKSKRALLEARVAIVCEGQLDLIACHEAGITNIVASQGTAFTERHGRLLKRYVEDVILMFDSDAAGQAAATRSVDALLQAGLSVRVATVPEGHDPDSLVRKEGAEALRHVVQSSRPFLDFYLDYLCAQHDPRRDTGRAAIARQMAEMLAKLPNAALGYSAVTATARRLQVPESVVRAEIRNAARAQRRDAFAEDETTGVSEYLSSSRKISTPERELLHLMLSDNAVLRLAAEELTLDCLPPSPCRALITKIMALHQTAQWRGAESLQSELVQDETSAVLSELLMTEPQHTNRIAAARQCIAALHQSAIDAERDVINERLSDPTLPPEEATALLKRLHELRQKSFDSRSMAAHIQKLSPG
jgi:DNA primase